MNHAEALPSFKLSLSPGMIAVFKVLVVTAIVTSVADVGLAAYIGPFNVRLSQLLIILAVPIFVIGVCVTGKVRVPPAGGWVLLWVALNGICIFNSQDYLRAILFQGWFILSLFLVTYTVNIYTTEMDVRRLLLWYLRGFTLHSVFGLSQMALYYGAGINVFMEQPGRLNGLTHEPSAFAGAQTIAYIMLREMMTRNIYVASRRSTAWSLWIIFLALLISTSKTAIVFVALYEGVFALRTIFGFLSRQGVRVWRLIHAGFCIMMVFLVVTFMPILEKTPLIFELASGTGLFGTAAHSVNERKKDLDNTFHVTIDHFWIGVSYGGLTYELRSLETNGYRLKDQGFDAGGTGMFLPAEILGATGIVGFLVISVYFIRLFWICQNLTGDMRQLARSMLIAFVLGLGALVSNFARGSIWAHLTVLSVVAASQRGKERGETPLPQPTQCDG